VCIYIYIWIYIYRERKREIDLRSSVQVGKELGERWRKLSTEEKEPYIAKQAADKLRYQGEMEVRLATV